MVQDRDMITTGHKWEMIDNVLDNGSSADVESQSPIAGLFNCIFSHSFTAVDKI